MRFYFISLRKGNSKWKHHREFLLQTEKDIQRTHTPCNSPFSSLLFSKKQVSIGNIPAQSVPDDFFFISISFSSRGSDCWAMWVILQLLPRPCGNYFMRESLTSCNAALAHVSAWCHDRAGAAMLDVDVRRFLRSPKWSPCFENMAPFLWIARGDRARERRERGVSFVICCYSSRRYSHRISEKMVVVGVS